MDRDGIFFTADVHLGLSTPDPKEREERFISFLKGIPGSAQALYLLGDIWDFWYEYRDVVPSCGARVVAELLRLENDGVKVYFMPGNHDIWCFSFFESLGMTKIEQPFFVQENGVRLCLGHGDGLGGAKLSFRLLKKIFTCRFLQRCFSTVHPYLAFRLGEFWSSRNRLTHRNYNFILEETPLYRFACGIDSGKKADLMIFGHYHNSADATLPGGSRLVVLDDWMKGGTPYARLNANGSFELHC